MSKLPRVIVIDDDPLFRSLIASILKKDYQVAVANEGAEGFYKSLDFQPDLAIVDIRMPGWDGFRTLKEFRGHPTLKSTKIVILTSDSEEGTLNAAIDGGADEFIVKTSFSKEEFRKKLKEQLCRDESSLDDASVRTLENSTPDSGAAATGPGKFAGEHRQDSSSLPPISTEESRLQEVIDSWE